VGVLERGLIDAQRRGALEPVVGGDHGVAVVDSLMTAAPTECEFTGRRGDGVEVGAGDPATRTRRPIHRRLRQQPMLTVPVASEP
jgi:hypothetical protein